MTEVTSSVHAYTHAHIHTHTHTQSGITNKKTLGITEVEGNLISCLCSTFKLAYSRDSSIEYFS